VPAAALAAGAVLAHSKSDPAILGRMERLSPCPKPAMATTPAPLICPVPSSCPCDAGQHLDSSSSSWPPPPPERYPGLEDEMQVGMETATAALLASPCAAALASNATSLNGMAGSQQPSSRCFQGNGDWCFASSSGHSGHTIAAPPQLDPIVAAEIKASDGREFSGSNRLHRMASAAFVAPSLSNGRLRHG
jgi:hypothetical protein